MSIRMTAASVLSAALLAVALPAGAGGPKTKLISKTSGERPATGGLSLDGSVSLDGRFVAFASDATNLPQANGFTQIYLRDRQNGITRLVSKNNPGNVGDGNSSAPSISSGGRYVAFASFAPNMPGDTDPSYTQVYLRDLQTDETFLVSRTNTEDPASGGSSQKPFVTSDGRFVAFESAAANLPGELNGESQIYIRDRQNGTTQLVSKNNPGNPANSDSDNPTVGGGGRFVAFESDAANLPGTNNTGEDLVYVRDRVDNDTFLVSRNSNEDPANGESSDATISGSGRFVAFESRATNLPGDLGGTYAQAYLRDRQSGTTRLVSKTAGGAPASNGGSENPSVTPDGRYVAFESYATNLPGTQGVTSIYVRDMMDPGASLVSKNNSGDPANGPSYIPPAARTITAQGEFAVFNSYAENLPGSIGPTYSQVYIRGPLS